MFHIDKYRRFVSMFSRSSTGFWFEPVNPGIVDSGLILHYDVSVSASYGGSGVNIFDLEGSSNGTLVNAPVYSTDNGGILTFNGVNEGIYTNTSLNSKFPGVSPNKSEAQSIFTWVYPISQGNVIVERGTPTLNDVSWFDSNIDVVDVGGNAEFRFSVWTGNLLSRVTSSQTFNDWYYVGWTYDGTILVGYVNGVSVGSVALNRIAPYNVGENFFFSIGSSTATNMGVSSYSNMKFGAFQVYNIAISSSQVLQNYNVARTRFGL